MNAIFHDLIDKFMPVYINYIVVKSEGKREHLEEQPFKIMRKHGLKMNHLKCSFGVSAGKFLGFLVQKKGVEVDLNKAKAIIESKPPKNKKELQSFLGKVNFLQRFIANLSGRTKVFSPLLKLKKDQEFQWQEED